MFTKSPAKPCTTPASAYRRHRAAVNRRSSRSWCDLENLPVDGRDDFPPLLFAWGKVDLELESPFLRKTWRVKPNYRWCSSRYRSKAITTIRKLFAASRVSRTSSAFKEASFDINLFTETVQALKRDKAAMRVLTGNDRFVAESYKLGANGALIGVANVATEQWAALDNAGSRGQIRRSARSERARISKGIGLQRAPIVEAVARIKVVLQHEGTDQTAKVRRPQR